MAGKQDELSKEKSKTSPNIPDLPGGEDEMPDEGMDEITTMMKV